MNIQAFKLVLLIGGGILLIDGVASWIKFYGQPAFYQWVRLERAVFAILLLIGGVLL